MPTDSRRPYEGLILAPVCVVDQGRVQRDILEVVAANSRTPQISAGALQAQLGAADVAKRWLNELYARFGDETTAEAADELIGYAARLARAFDRALPDGRYPTETVVE
jgi:N-methylhydantoinase B